MKPNLISGTYTSAGTVGVIYADTTDDLAMDEYIGVDKRQLASGSVAYLKNQDTLIFDSTGHWVTDDGTVIDNYVKEWVIPMQTVRATHDWLPEQGFTTVDGLATLDGILVFTVVDWGLENIGTLIFDGKTYEDIPYDTDEDAYCFEADGNNVLISTTEQPYQYEIAIEDKDGNPINGKHTIRAYQDYPNWNMARLVDVETLPSDKLIVVFDSEKYELPMQSYDDGIITYDYCGGEFTMDGGQMDFDLSTYPFSVGNVVSVPLSYNDNIVVVGDTNEHTIGAYVMKKEESEDFEMFFDFSLTTGEIVEVSTDVTPNDVLSALSDNKYPIARVSVNGAELYLPLTFCAGDEVIEFTGNANENLVSIRYYNGNWIASM